MKYIKRIIYIVIGILVIGFAGRAIKSARTYEKECVYEKEVATGIVKSKETHRRMSCAKPVMYRTVYETEVLLLDGTQKTYTDAEIYNVCEIGDEILYEVTRKFHNGKLIDVTYNELSSSGKENVK